MIEGVRNKSKTRVHDKPRDTFSSSGSPPRCHEKLDMVPVASLRSARGGQGILGGD